MTASRERLVFGEPFFDEAEEELLVQTLRSAWIGQGPLVERFEQRLVEDLGAPHVVSVSSCTAALHLSLVACGIGPGDEVVTTPFTFVATVNAIEHAGATPVLVDIDPATLNITPEAVERALTDRTRAVMPVHFGGRSLDVQGFQALADAHDLWIIEDAAHAIGGVAAGHPVGGSAHPRVLSCFSFYPNKNLASAEGGAIALAAGEVAERLRTLRLHGLSGDAWDRYRRTAYRPSLAVEAGFKSNWTDLQAAIALPQLDKLEGFLAVREWLAERYDELLADVEGVSPVDRGPCDLESRHALHLYQVMVEGGHEARDQLLADLLPRRVPVALHYIAIDQHPYYAGRLGGPFEVSNWATDHLLTLPLHPQLGDGDLSFVVDELDAALAGQDRP